MYLFPHTISNFSPCPKIAKNLHHLIGDDFKDTKYFCSVVIYLPILQFP